MAANRYRLVIGNKNWSSWSLRPWLAMRRAGLLFDEINVRLRLPESKVEILKHSPSGLVPTLIDGDLAVWDSLAILEYVAERHPEAELWPREARARAIARSASAEMHSGFGPLRQHCSMEVLASSPQATLPPEVEANVQRIVALWLECREKFGKGGPFLFGKFSIADAMYAPVAARFRTYIPDLRPYGDDGSAQAYVETIFAMPEMAAWIEGARSEIAA
jgi:glutathione S-transferase